MLKVDDSPSFWRLVWREGSLSSELERVASDLLRESPVLDVQSALMATQGRRQTSKAVQPPGSRGAPANDNSKSVQFLSSHRRPSHGGVDVQGAEWRRQKLLQLTFQDYYRTSPDNIRPPARIREREFAFESFVHTWRCSERETTRRWVLSRHTADEVVKIGCTRSGTELVRRRVCPECGTPGLQWNNWTRHLGFGSREELVRALVESPAVGVYHSAAFYEVPVAKSMEEKKWRGAELVFDIDADHLSLPCTKTHDAWVCNNPECGATGSGTPPQGGCPSCGGTSISVQKWLCDRCLSEAKSQARRLVDEFLTSDLGIDPQSIYLNYSGHRGYHVRVNSAEVERLDSAARVELVHFITGKGLNSDRFVAPMESSVVIPDRQAPGWHGRTADALLKFVREIDSYTGRERWVQSLRDARSRELLIEGLSRNPPILSGAVRGIGLGFWRQIAARAIEDYGVSIDEPVTHDVHRIIRLMGSLHGKTGFIVAQLTRDQLDTFDPFRDSLAFTGEQRVWIPPSPLGVPAFRVGDDTFGPYNDETVDLPMAAAVFLLCKGVASVE
ncbi:MAG: hypothetical protein HXY34_01925 [Candidatus Thorarchaeota archaeon]|nr:hypothetical protein [Candidatus Thorarchaeota archaeon]